MDALTLAIIAQHQPLRAVAYRIRPADPHSPHYIKGVFWAHAACLLARPRSAYTLVREPTLTDEPPIPACQIDDCLHPGKVTEAEDTWTR